MLRIISRKSFIVPVLALGALALFPSSSQANVQGDWILQLAGVGSNDHGFVHSSYVVDGTVGYFVTNNLQINVLQAISTTNKPSSTAGLSQVAGLWNFPLNAQWDLYAGGNIGFTYGTRIKGDGEAGPEGGVKFNINSKTYVFFDVQWDFNFYSSHGGGNTTIAGGAAVYKDSEFIYQLGLGVTLN